MCKQHMKTIKKIVALGLGISMVGATLGAVAAAADLNDYPSPFIQNGKFAGTLVVGDKAAAEDVIGVSDVAMSLQYAASVKAGSGAGASTTIEGDAFQVRESGDELNLYENLNNVTTVIDDQDLKALADATLRAKNDAKYTQELTLPQINVQFTTDDNADVEDPALFLKFPNARTAFTYKLDFSTPAESDMDTTTMKDYEDEKISILGKEYTITNAVNRSAATKLTLMACAYQTTQEVGETKTYNVNGKDYEVTIVVVSGDTSASALTKLLVNDETTPSLSKDDTYTLKDGLEIGIKEILPTKAGDIQQNLVEFFLGAEKMVLDGTAGTLEISEENIDDTVVTITNDILSTGRRISQIQIVWTLDEDYYVPVGGKLSEYITDNDEYVKLLSKLGVDYNFASVAPSNSETLRFVPGGDSKYKIEFTNKKGVKYSEEVFYYNASAGTNTSGAPGGTVSLGKAAGDSLYTTEGSIVCDGHRFVTEYNKNSRILKYSSKSSTDKTITLRDEGEGKSYDYTYSLTAGQNYSTVNLDGASFSLQVQDNGCLILNETTDGGTDANF